MVEVTDAPPSEAEKSAAEKVHWKTKQKQEREAAEAASAKAKPKEPEGGWPGDTPPTVDPVVQVTPPPNAAPVPAPSTVVTYFEFCLRYFTSNQIRVESYSAPNPIRSIASDCLNAYHAYVYAVALGLGITTKLPDAKRFGGILKIHEDVAGAVAAMDREMQTKV